MRQSVQVFDGDGLSDDLYRQQSDAAELIKQLLSFEIEVRKLSVEAEHPASVDPKTVGEAFSHFASLLNWLNETEPYDRSGRAIMDLGHLAGHLMQCGYQHLAVRLGTFIAKVNVIYESRSR